MYTQNLKGKHQTVMSSPLDISKFRKWLVEHQNKLVKELWREQRKVQETLVKDLYNTLKESHTGPSWGKVLHWP